MCYTANEDNTGFSFVDCADGNYTDKMIWTAQVRNEYVCGYQHANHHGPQTVLQLVQDGKAVKLYDNAAKSMAATTDLATNIEFIQLTSAQSGRADECIFEFHINLDPNDLTHFRQIFAILPTGANGWYSRANSYGGFDVLAGTNAAAGSCYSGLTKVYLVIDPQNLEPAAKAFWNQIIENDIAAHPGYTDLYKAALRERALPEITDEMTADNLYDELLTIYNNFGVDFTDAWLPANTYRPNGANIYSKGIPYVSLHTDNGANNISVDSNYFKLHKGSNANICGYTFKSYNPLAAVAGFEFDATGDAIITIDGVATTLTSEPQHFSGLNTLSISGNNNDVNISSFTIKRDKTNAELYDQLSTNGGIPTTSGWYQVVHVKGIDAQLGNYIATTDEVAHVSSGSTYYYALTVKSDISAKPAETYVKFEVDGNNHAIKLQNGHYLHANTYSQLSSANLGIETDATDNTTVRLERWLTFNPTSNNSLTRIGAGSSGNNNRWIVIPVDPTADYDLWTVNITGVANLGSNLNTNRSYYVTCNIAANKGNTSAYNGGTFFLTKGTTLSAANLTVVRPENAEVAPVITVNNTDHTITVEFLSKEAYLDGKYSQLEADYSIYTREALFNQETVTGILDAAHSTIIEAAGEGATFSNAQIAAVDESCALYAAANHEAEIVATLSQLDGKLFYFQNLNYTNSFLTVGMNGQVERLTGSTTKSTLGSLWQLVAYDKDAHQYYLRNYGDGKYVQSYTHNGGSDERDITMTSEIAEAHPYTIEFAHNNNVSGFSFKDTDSASKQHYLHLKGNNARLVKWTILTTSPASGWRSSCMEQDEVDFTPSVENSVHQLTFAGTALHSGVNYADHHRITVWTTDEVETDNEEEAAPAAAPRRAKSYVVNDDEPCAYGDLTTASDSEAGVVVSLTKMLDEGVYEVRVPAAVFTVGDKHNKSLVATISVDANGAVTGLNELPTTHSPLPTQIYDLQGRRLSKPVRGINIINGRKVLVK